MRIVHADIQGYAGKGLHSNDRRDSLSFGGQHPWSAQGGGPGGLTSRGGQHMSAQVLPNNHSIKLYSTFKCMYCL